MGTKQNRQRAIYILLRHCFRGSVMLSPAFHHMKQKIKANLPYDGVNQKTDTISTNIHACEAVVEWKGTDSVKAGRIDVFSDNAQPKVSFRYDPVKMQWVLWANLPKACYIWRFKDSKRFEMIIVNYSDRANPERVDIDNCFADMKYPTDQECKMMQLLYGDDHIAALKLLHAGMKDLTDKVFNAYRDYENTQKIKALKNKEKRERRKKVAEFKEKIQDVMYLKWGQK